MRSNHRSRFVSVVAFALLVSGTASPVGAAGFAIFEQGGKALGMGGAFTAQADDPSTMFFNVGGVAFFDEREFYAGISLISLGDSTFQGTEPFPGSSETGEQKKQLVTPPHFYWVQPINERLNFGLGLNAPFGLVTEWDDKDNWSGRFLSEKAELINVDLNPNVGYRISEKTGIAFGVIARFVEVELTSRSAAVNPITQQPTDISENTLTSDMETGIGWNLGIVHHFTDSLTAGLSYRSKMEVDFAGDAAFEQVPSGNDVFDDIVAGLLPDGAVPIETSIEFPDMASLGFAYKFGSSWLAEIDFNWTGWSSFDTLVVDFASSSGLDPLVRPQNWDDVMNYRSGAQYTLSDRTQIRFGLYFDESPQPDETVSPLLPDADRWGYSVGYGYTGETFDIDAYFLFVDFDDRTTTTNIDNFNGTYSTTVWIVGGSVGF